jgi:hypothetical protein
MAPRNAFQVANQKIVDPLPGLGSAYLDMRNRVSVSASYFIHTPADPMRLYI